MSKIPDQVWVMLPTGGSSRAWVEATTSLVRAVTYDGPDRPYVAQCYVPAEAAYQAYRAGVSDGRLEAAQHPPTDALPSGWRWSYQVEASLSDDRRVERWLAVCDERQLEADDAASAWRQAAMTVECDDLIDEDPTPPGWDMLGLGGDLCGRRIRHKDSLIGVRVSVRRARDAWAHHHGWPELARGGK